MLIISRFPLRKTERKVSKNLLNIKDLLSFSYGYFSLVCTKKPQTTDYGGTQWLPQSLRHISDVLPIIWSNSHSACQLVEMARTMC